MTHKRIYIICLVVMLTLFYVMLCDCKAEEHHVMGKTEVDAVYWHEGRRYTFITIDENNKLIFTRVPVFSYKVKLDVTIDAKNKCWYEYNYITDWGGAYGWFKIHLTSLDDLKTADWNHGKFGSGTTTRIR